MAYQECDKRLSIIDVKLGASRRSGGPCGRHGRWVRPAPTTTGESPFVHLLIMARPDPSHTFSVFADVSSTASPAIESLRPGEFEFKGQHQR